jgi:hypothetical protein
LPEPVHGGVQTMLEIPERATRPEVLLKFFTSDNLAWSGEKNRQNPQRLALQTYSHSMLAQFTRRLLILIRAKGDLSGSVCSYLTAHKPSVPIRLAEMRHPHKLLKFKCFHGEVILYADLTHLALYET